MICLLGSPRLSCELLSHGLPSREIIESGPPEEIANAFQELFGAEIKAAKVAGQAARR